MKKPPYINDDTWGKMSRKEQDFVILLRERQWTKNQIKRKLYITTDWGYNKLKRKVQLKISAQYSLSADSNSVLKEQQTTSIAAENT